MSEVGRFGLARRAILAGWLAILPQTVFGELEPDLTKLWADARQGGVFKALAEGEFERLGTILTAVIADPQSWPVHREALSQAGFSLSEGLLGSERILIVREVDPARSGQGLFLIRLDAAQPVCLEAPHGDSDLMTGQIALRLFREHPVRAVALNTLHRSRGDLARHDRTGFQAFTVAFAVAVPLGQIVQLHGYERSARKTPNAIGSHSIVAGTLSRATIESLAARLAEAIGEKVLVSPWQTRELLGSVNVQRMALEDRDFAGFAHVELSLELRTRLKASPRLRSRFLRSLVGRNP